MAVVAHPRAAEAPRGSSPRSRVVSLLDADPDLGTELTPGRFALARTHLLVRCVTLPRGEWHGADKATLGGTHVGLLILDGVIAREVILEDTVSTELLGAGDVIRPWASHGAPALLQQQLRWQVLARAQVAVLGRNFAAAVQAFPEVNAAVTDRLCARAERLATSQAISQLNSVERRLVALFWHLAERWGRMTPDGVVVPLTLSHRLIGELVGARRPTVSTALRGLERQGRLIRRADATWVIAGEPSGAPAGSTQRLIPHRRRLLAPEPELAGAEAH